MLSVSLIVHPFLHFVVVYLLIWFSSLNILSLSLLFLIFVFLQKLKLNELMTKFPSGIREQTCMKKQTHIQALPNNGA